MARHPYVGLPDRQFWKRDAANAAQTGFDPISPPDFALTRDHKVVTAGSCFAQHVARYINQSGFSHFIAEPAHEIIPKPLAEAYNYGLFSARYGNIYTARQLLQLLHRAYGLYDPELAEWPHPHREDHGVDSIVDPFRPQIQPRGFRSQAELQADRQQHFKAIRSAVETMDVFVFTLGLTECWADISTGAVYPIAPGVAGGTWNPDQTEFQNFDETETAADMRAALSFIRERNPNVQFILTVSPVPLNATMESKHVLVSTTWSKAVLRIVAEKMTREFDHCTYFPSYEIITAPQMRGQYYAEDAREVTEAGVNHVMGLFFRHFAGTEVTTNKTPAPPIQDAHMELLAETIEVLCDEASIDNQG